MLRKDKERAGHRWVLLASRILGKPTFLEQKRNKANIFHLTTHTPFQSCHPSASLFSRNLTFSREHLDELGKQILFLKGMPGNR